MEQTRRQGHELDSEIDLREYVRIALKRKKIVLGVFFISVILTAVWSILTPKVYEVSVIIGPPIMSLTYTGILELDSIGNMRAKIEAGVFNAKITEALNIPEKDLKFAIAQPRDARFIKVSLNRTAAEVDEGKKALAKLVELLSASYTKNIEDRRVRILSQIASKERAVKAGLSSGVDPIDGTVRNDRAELDSLKLSVAVMNNVALIQEPHVSLEPIGPRKRKNVQAAGFAGLIVGILAALVAEYREGSRRNS